MDCEVFSQPSYLQGDPVNYATLPTLQTSAILDLDSVFLPKLLLEHVPKGAWSTWDVSYQTCAQTTVKILQVFSSGVSFLCSLDIFLVVQLRVVAQTGRKFYL